MSWWLLRLAWLFLSCKVECQLCAKILCTTYHWWWTDLHGSWRASNIGKLAVCTGIEAGYSWQMYPSIARKLPCILDSTQVRFMNSPLGIMNLSWASHDLCWPCCLQLYLQRLAWTKDFLEILCLNNIGKYCQQYFLLYIILFEAYLSVLPVG